ncbi:hypothetical protein F2Q69_00057831 [Brassica cretica]|uniref:LisH domain-containing protein n=1 Tax=Brassica cretica TaxID=69181 RepID=A0A8S9MUP5_BRACR|nr:hypothetical protein F2Q69_00057831 [Brassica cretica]
MSQTNWEADKMLDVYIYDYLVKRDLKATAQAFQAEGKVSPDPVGKYITNLLEFFLTTILRKDDLICSCDNDGEIRYWSINNGSCTRVYKGGSTQMRFQPRVGKYLAASSSNVVSVLDVETQACRHSLQGHANPINSVCWDPSGDFLATVSEDMVKVWTLGTGSEGECVHELSCNGNKFQSCVFHPTYPSLLVIGCYQSLELWNMSENKTMALPAHEGLIASLAVSTATGLVASASHDKLVKLWK